MTAALSLAMISTGVPLGAHRPYQTLMSSPGKPASPTVGISGADSMRALAVTA
jgi:hypothetical protein